MTGPTRMFEVEHRARSMSVVEASDNLLALQAGDCVAIIFPGGVRRAARVENARDGAIECWGFCFRSPDFSWEDPLTGDMLYLAAPFESERRELWRRIARSRLLSLTWDSSDNLSDDQLERILDILNEQK